MKKFLFFAGFLGGYFLGHWHGVSYGVDQEKNDELHRKLGGH
jgi:hypothetical protein